MPRKLIYDLEEGLQPKVPKRNYQFFSLFSLFSLSYFCLDTKVPKNQGKKNAARSAHPLSGSIKTRHFLLLSYEEMQTTSGFARTAKLIVIHSTAASAFCRAYARASWQMVWSPPELTLFD